MTLLCVMISLKIECKFFFPSTNKLLVYIYRTKKLQKYAITHVFMDKIALWKYSLITQKTDLARHVMKWSQL